MVVSSLLKKKYIYHFVTSLKSRFELNIENEPQTILKLKISYWLSEEVQNLKHFLTKPDH